MRFSLIDRVLEQDGERIVALKQVTSAEEYLLDHFPGFPILPGVMMLEALVQAGRTLAASVDPACGRHVLGTVRALKYGAMIKPGDALQIEVTIVNRDGDTLDCKGVGRKIPAGGAPDGEELDTAVSGRFTLRPIRVGASAGA